MAPRWGLVISPNDGFSRALPFVAPFRPFGANCLGSRMQRSVAALVMWFTNLLHHAALHRTLHNANPETP